MIFCKRPVNPDDHLQDLVQPDDHLQEASPSRWSFARGRSLQMIICKRPANSDDHLQEAILSGWSFARGWSIQMIICSCPLAFVVGLFHLLFVPACCWSLFVVCCVSLFVFYQYVIICCLSVSFVVICWYGKGRLQASPSRRSFARG